jgi:uncharacterized protein YjbI with pentapeptide repeats
MTHATVKNNPNQKQSWTPSETIKIIFHANLLLRVLIGCESENFQAIESIFTLIYAKEITAYVEDSQIAVIKQYIYRFAGDRADALVASLDTDFETYSVTLDDIERVSELTIDNLDTGIAIACAERKKIDVVIAETVQVISGDFDIPVVNPQEFMLRYDAQNRRLKDDAVIPHSSFTKNTDEQLEINLKSIEPIESIIDIKLGEWNVESFETVIQLKDDTKGSVKLWNSNKCEYISKNATGNGPVDALVKALNLALIEANPQTQIPPLVVDDVLLQSEEKGADSPVLANVTLVLPNNTSVRGEFRHTDTVKAVFCACVKATADYVNHSNVEKYLNKLTVKQLKQDLYYKRSLNYQDVYLLRFTFTTKDYWGLKLENALITQSNFDQVNISNYEIPATWKQTCIYSSTLNESMFRGAYLQDLEIHNSYFKKADFSCARLNRVKIRSSHFTDAQLDKVKFSNCIIQNGSFEKANFKYSHFRSLVFTGADLKSAKFIECELHTTYLVKAVLVNALFDTSIIKYSNFMSADLTNASFIGVKFDEVSFAMANLEGANFSDCDLRRVNLNGAILSNADLTGATISSSQLECADCRNLDKSKIKEIVDGSCEWDESNENRLHKCF